MTDRQRPETDTERRAREAIQWLDAVEAERRTAAIQYLVYIVILAGALVTFSLCAWGCT